MAGELPGIPADIAGIKNYFEGYKTLELPPGPDILQTVEITKGSNLVEFPILRTEPVEAGFSWGKDQMSDIWAEKNLRARGITDETLIKKAKAEALVRRDQFLLSGEMSVPPRVAKIAPAKVKEEHQIEEVTQEDVNKHMASGANDAMDVAANFIVTRVEGLTLQVNPADCPSYVLSGRDAKGEPILGLLHAGRDEVNEELPKKAILYMKAMGCDLSTLKIAGCPGVAKENYYIQEKDRETVLKGNDAIWGNKLSVGEAIENGKKVPVVYLDLLGRAIDQFTQVGMRANQIQAYGVDTYEAAKRGETFSHRWWQNVNKKENPEYPVDSGRMTLAAMIKNPDVTNITKSSPVTSQNT